ncbi:hypothetical protein DEU56DRAFT_841127 [Suillus clintonianus]|uniref:uncharacterized protein n=1 Tax=Suillus clintonianus TaxID=1904413 RepID=UPI001B8654DC|nr:uncharacterized protein DEU56DRAFT_841127 [Suillus clintonianus]KAG2115461.1 hypothetical protein DEU56DRAFT_841127 [Suillus clintonianus]
MARRSSTTFEFSIPGDELEQYRIQLEQQIQNTDLSLHLSSSQGDDDSVEYPRHNSNHSLGFPSFEQPSQHFDYDAPSGLHAWSTHEDEGVNPYVGETVSTIGHHASAVTIGAGLGGRGQRREVSLSGAEYDPERPLQDMIAGMDSRISILEPHSKSRQTPYPREPLDASGDCDLSQVSQPAALAARLRSPHLEPESAESEADRSQNISRRKLSDNLQRVGFSPRRPRNLQSRTMAQQSPSRSHSYVHGAHDSQHIPSYSRKATTSKPRKASHSVSFDVDATPVRRHVSQPQVNVQPPTPSASSSKFTRMARGLAKDVHEAQAEEAALFQNQSQTTTIPRAAPVGSRRVSMKHHDTLKQPLHDVADHSAVDVNVEISQPNRSFRKASRGRVNLPDLTGLTSAVVSPAKANLERYGIKTAGSSKEVESRLIASLNALHSKLAHLETENGIARRRVRELEYELQQCKRDVARERSRIIEQDAGETSWKRGKEERRDREEEQSKYFEVVEEKKALESLISTLRSHLTRVTTELTAQQQLLEDLKRLREDDAKMLAEKTDEIGALRLEVERLAGEIEVLRNVVEEGLNERRMAREQQSQLVEGKDEVSVLDHSNQELNQSHQGPDPVTTRASLQSTRRFVDVDELTRISEDLEERRSERSSCGSPSLSSRHSSRSHPGDITRLTDSEESRRHATRREPSGDDEVAPLPRISEDLEEQRSEGSSCGNASLSSRHGSRPGDTTHARLTEPEDGRRPVIRRETLKDDEAAPFPRIRSGRLENLFFSAPKHNSGTCTRCNHRSARIGSHVNSKTTRPSQGRAPPLNDQGSSAQVKNDHFKSRANVFEPDGVDSYEALFQGDKLPPQTVLARVLRELEEEFTHHKGIYSELADEYKGMDSMVQAARRRIVADHLRDIIDLIERKVDQIQSLYDLLKFEDKPSSRQRIS